MPSPFPGMDPYLEDPARWPGFHDVFLTVCMFEIEQCLPEGYVSDLREQSQTISIDDEVAEVYIPDISVARDRVNRRKQRLAEESATAGGLALQAKPVTIPIAEEVFEIKENYIEILRLPERDLVTTVELLSPWNKAGDGVREYRGKRQSIVSHGVHMVELDLLRRGRRTELARPLPPADYYAMLFRANRRPDVEVYGWTLRDPLPTIPIPLLSTDADITLNLATVVTTAYDRGRYDRKLRYHLPVPQPDLSTEDATWVAELLRRNEQV